MMNYLKNDVLLGALWNEKYVPVQESKAQRMIVIKSSVAFSLVTALLLIFGC